MERRVFLKISSGAALGGAIAACGGGGGSPGTPPPTNPPPEPAAASAALQWNKVALAAILTGRTPPPIAARALAITHTAMYDAWAAYDAVALGTRLGAQLRQNAAARTAANQTRAYSYAAYLALVDQFPAQKAAFDLHLTTMGYSPADAIPGDASPAGIGSKAALAVLAYRHSDGANQLGDLAPGGVPFADYSGYVPRNPPLAVVEPTPRSAIPYPGHWQPLRFRDAGGVVRTQSYLTPFWGEVKPFALASGQQFRPGPPAAFGTPAFDEQARLLVETQRDLSELQMALADFWAGGTAGELPTTYWSAFAQMISRRDRLDADGDIKLFFALANANFDAGIAAWDAKRAFDSARPITAIRYLYAGQSVSSFGPDGPAAGLRLVPGEVWMPYHLASAPTPNHPDHVSGHSTYSAASAEVLRRFTGSDRFEHSVTLKARSLLFDPALPRADLTLTWPTFSAAANEAGNSRILAGIHFPMANEAGKSLGTQVGAAAYKRAQNYWLGRCVATCT